MRRLSLSVLCALASLVLTAQARAQDPRLDFHYNWVGQAALDSAAWSEGAGMAASIEASGRVYLDHQGGGFRTMTSVNPVVRPHPQTGAFEMIIDLWQGDGQQVPNANYTSRPHPADGFFDLGMALAISNTGGDTNWTICVNGGNCVQEAATYANKPVRMRISTSGLPGAGILLDARPLDNATGLFTGPWSPVPAHNKLVDFDLTKNGGPPYNFAFTIQGDSRWGMVEVYQTTGNEGTLPAAGNTDLATPGGGYPANGLQAGLDFHYNWIGQAGAGGGGGIDPADWEVSGGISGTSVDANGRLFIDNGAGWQEMRSLATAVRPNAVTGAVELIADCYNPTNSLVNFGARPSTSGATAGFPDPIFRLAVTHPGGANDWTICVNGACGGSPPGVYTATRPVRVRLSSSGEAGAGANLDARLLDGTTGEFIGDWLPIPATNRPTDLNLTPGGGLDPPWKFGFQVFGNGTFAMVEVYTNTGNPGTIPAPGNTSGAAPAGGFPPNGFQDAGACTLPGGQCSELSEGACTTAGGTYLGTGTVCATGACDLPGNDCLILTSGECEIDNGGVYLGDDSGCPTGACDLPGGTCSVITFNECESVNGGTYAGDGTACPPVIPELDFHYDWVGQEGGTISTVDWELSPSLAGTLVTAEGRLSVDNVSGWGQWQSVRDVVRPHPSTGALELIFDLWGQNSFVNYHARYSNAIAGPGFGESFMAMGPSFVGSSNWTFCVNKSCIQPPGTYPGVPPMRMRMSSSGGVGAGTNLDARLLDAATGLFIGEWTPVPATNRAAPDLNLLGTDPGNPDPEDPPFKFGVAQLGTSLVGMVEVYQNLGNDGTLPAPGNTDGATPPGGLPPNGFQDVGACILPGGQCSELDLAACATAGGVHQGIGTPCPTGACDLAGDNCLILNSGQCEIDNGGSYLGDGTSCPTGACDLPGGTCSVLTFDSCVAQNGGTYNGDGSSCPAVVPNLDYHYNWVGQAGAGGGGGIDPADWTVGPGIVATVTAEGRLALAHSGGWRSVRSVGDAVRPHPGTGDVEIIVDLWERAFLANWHAKYPSVDHPDDGFGEPAMALGATNVGETPGGGGPGWTFCVNASCIQPPAIFSGAVPVRMRMSSSGALFTGTNLDGRLLDPATGEFVGDWFPLPARNRAAPDLDLGKNGGPPYEFGFTILGGATFTMVEVYQNLGNDGTLPAPGNDMGLLPAGGLPPNGLQPLTGACQLPPGGGGGTVGPCADLTEEDCAAQSGTFDGRGTACPDLGVSIKPGDTNQDGVLDLSDPVAFLAWFFGGAPLPPNASLCLVNPNSPVPGPATAVGLQVMDWNCDLALDISDATAQLSWQFGTGAAHCDCTDAACSNCIQVVSPDCLDSCTP